MLGCWGLHLYWDTLQMKMLFQFIKCWFLWLSQDKPLQTSFCLWCFCDSHGCEGVFRRIMWSTCKLYLNPGKSSLHVVNCKFIEVIRCYALLLILLCVFCLQSIWLHFYMSKTTCPYQFVKDNISFCKTTYYLDEFAKNCSIFSIYWLLLVKVPYLLLISI